MKPNVDTNRKLYLDLLKKSVLDIIYEPITDKLIEGTVHPVRAHTMIGIVRLDNVQECYESILRDGIEGDLIETGVWRGGVTIFMAGMIKAHGDNRKVYVADSFEGLPKPNEEKYPVDKGDPHHLFADLRISLDTVKNNFKVYDLLDDNVIFLKGWFKDTLPQLKQQNVKFSMLRLDGDMYESTWDALTNLYDKLSPGGYIIIDDWSINGARQATLDFRAQNNITDEIITINRISVYWRKDEKLFKKSEN